MTHCEKHVFVEFFCLKIVLKENSNCNFAIALFTDNFTHLHYNTIQRGYEAISGSFVIFARNCLAFAFNFIVIQT